MNKNQNSRFSLNPKVSMPRSRFDMSSELLTSLDAGLAIPLNWWEILPGDSFDVKTSMVVRMQTLMTPAFADMFMDVMWFFVPNRLLWKHWVNFCGESDEPWFDDTVYTVPQLEFDDAPGNTNRDHTIEVATIADYMGLPVRRAGNNTTPHMTKVDHLPFRAYCRCWNEWLRNENVQALTAFNMEDNDVTLTIGENATAFNGGALPLPVNKFKDYFTSCLPSPQKGPAVTIGVGDVAPVFTGATAHDWETLKHGGSYVPALQWRRTGSEDATVTGKHNIFAYTSSESSNASAAIDSATISSTNNWTVTPSNLYADISNATGISINELRIAFATQQMYEQLARGGSRYIEILSNLFHVDAGDARLQRSEFLGANRCRINISQVTQQSETNTTPLGDVGAYSLTTDTQDSFHKSFTEHGILLAIGMIRYQHSYQQGIDRKWLKKDKADYYWPVYANIGEQPVYNKELFTTGTNKEDEVFGYQEAWSSYRYGINKITGEFRSDYALSLDNWHLGDDYNALPALSAGFVTEQGQTLDRITAVQQNLANQFMADIWFC